jgi:hypothetical protein
LHCSLAPAALFPAKARDVIIMLRKGIAMGRQALAVQASITLVMAAIRVAQIAAIPQVNNIVGA